MSEEEVRPRYGVVRHLDNTETLVTFVPSGLKETFRMVRADNEEPMILAPGELFQVLGKVKEGQAVLYRLGDGTDMVGRIRRRGRYSKEGFLVNDNNDEKKSMSPWAALGMLATTLGIVVAAIAAIKFIFWGF